MPRVLSAWRGDLGTGLEIAGCERRAGAAEDDPRVGWGPGLTAIGCGAQRRAESSGLDLAFRACDKVC